MGLQSYFHDDKVWAKFSLARVVFWTVMLPIAVLMDWVSSVAFIAVISIYANWAGDVAAWRSDVNPTLDRIEKKLDDLFARLEGGIDD